MFSGSRAVGKRAIGAVAETGDYYTPQ